MRSPRIAISWPDRDLWVARVFTWRAKIINLNERYPWAAGVVGVPLTLIGLAGVVAVPYLFASLLLLIGVGLVVIEYYADQQEADEHQAHVAASIRKWNPLSPIGQATMQGELNLPQPESEDRARAEANEARALAVEARHRAAEAQAVAAEARKQAEVAEARARATQLRLEGEAKTVPTLQVD
jgi:colicin import membrane protein